MGESPAGVRAVSQVVLRSVAAVPSNNNNTIGVGGVGGGVGGNTNASTGVATTTTTRIPPPTVLDDPMQLSHSQLEFNLSAWSPSALSPTTQADVSHNTILYAAGIMEVANSAI